MPRAGPVCWSRWQAPDSHDLAWRIFFAALRMSVEHRVEHIRLAVVWPGNSPHAGRYLLTSGTAMEVRRV